MTGRNSFALAFYCSCHRYRQRRRTFSLRELRPGIDGSNAPAATYAPNRTNPAESKEGETEECAHHRRHSCCRASVQLREKRRKTKPKNDTANGWMLLRSSVDHGPASIPPDGSVGPCVASDPRRRDTNACARQPP